MPPSVESLIDRVAGLGDTGVGDVPSPSRKCCERMQRRHGITAQVANDAFRDVNRVVIDPDYNSSGVRSVRIIGFSLAAEKIITVIVLEDDGVEYGVNRWVANEKDRRLHNEGAQDEARD